MVDMSPSLLICSSVDGHLGCFQFLSIMNKAKQLYSDMFCILGFVCCFSWKSIWKEGRKEGRKERRSLATLMCGM